MNFFTDENYERLFKTLPCAASYDVGDTISGKYVVTKVLSGGSNSDVYKARDTLKNADVVIKFIKGSAFDGETSKIQNRAVRELEKWSSIPRHREIVPVCDGFYDMRLQKFAIVSPFVETTHPFGLTLADLMEKGYPFTADDAQLLIYRIYRIIAELKSKTGKLYIHKDIRPENIFISSPDGSRKFKKCTPLLADCGSYSSFARLLPNDFRSLAPSAKDVFMLINTAKKMCKSLNPDLAAFCDGLGKNSTILDFENYFGKGPADLRRDSFDVKESLEVAYAGFTFTEKASEKSGKVTEEFNKLCEEYAEKYKDSVLPMFLSAKDSQHCDRHDDALMRLEVLAQHMDLWDESPARLYSEYSRDFSGEMLITLSISAFHHTDLFSASADERKRLCNLFKAIDLVPCFDLSFLDIAAELCEFMIIIEGDKSLLDHFASATDRLCAADDKPSPQLMRDRRLWRNVFGCMNAKDKKEKSRFAHDTEELLRSEPCNICYLFYTAKLLMLSSEFTAATPYCFLTTDIIDCVLGHIVQKDTSKTLLLYQTLTSYWTKSFDLALYYCKKALSLLTDDKEGKATVPGDVGIFSKLRHHIENERAIFNENTDKTLKRIAEDKNEIYSDEKNNLYNVASRAAYISSLPCTITEKILKTKKVDVKSLADSLDCLRTIDKDMPEAAYLASFLFAFTKQFEQAESAMKDYCIKMRFSYPENPFNRDDERNKASGQFYSQIKKEAFDFIANSFNINVIELENQDYEKTKENGYGTDIEYY